MCGIIGIASKTPVYDRGWLAAGRDALRHRGPDDVVGWWSADGRLGLGSDEISFGFCIPQCV